MEHFCSTKFASSTTINMLADCIQCKMYVGLHRPSLSDANMHKRKMKSLRLAFNLDFKKLTNAWLVWIIMQNNSFPFTSYLTKYSFSDFCKGKIKSENSPKYRKNIMSGFFSSNFNFWWVLQTTSGRPCHLVILFVTWLVQLTDVLSRLGGTMTSNLNSSSSTFLGSKSGKQSPQNHMISTLYLVLQMDLRQCMARYQ